MNGGDNWKRDRRDTRISKKQKLILNAEEQLESKLGFNFFTEGDKRLGWLLTLASVSPRIFPVWSVHFISITLIIIVIF